MLVCSCTMAGTAACRNCPTYIKEFGGGWNLSEWYADIARNNWTFCEAMDNAPTIYYPFDSNKYALVEKKDWKINQLKADIEIFKEDIRNNEEELKKLFELKTKLYDALTIAREELKELEK